MADNVVPGKMSIEKQKQGLIGALRGIPVTEQHVDKIIGIVSEITQYQVQKDLAIAQSMIEVQRIAREFEDDANRCDRAVEYLERLMARMSDEDVSQMAQAIIYTILKK